MIVLALAGSVLVGNDFRFGSLPFYLSKPLGRWHYVLGKCLAVAVFVNVMTTILALILLVEYGLLDSWDYFVEHVAAGARHRRLRAGADGGAEPAAGGDGELAAEDGADDHGLDDAVRLRPRPRARSWRSVTGDNPHWRLIDCGRTCTSSAAGCCGLRRRPMACIRRQAKRRSCLASSVQAVLSS